jgi:hypothetical protein
MKLETKNKLAEQTLITLLFSALEYKPSTISAFGVLSTYVDPHFCHLYCIITNQHDRQFETYSPQQALEVHHVIIVLFSFVNEHLYTDCCHTSFQNYMELRRN